MFGPGRGQWLTGTGAGSVARARSAKCGVTRLAIYPRGYTEPMSLNLIGVTPVSKASSCIARLTPTKQRVLFSLAGSFTLLGALLSVAVSRWFALVPVLVGANQLFLATTGWCPMSKLLDRVIRDRSPRGE